MNVATTQVTAYVEVRGQHAKGSWPNQGPDTYVAVQVVPDGVQPLKVLNRKAARKRGIEIIYCGEGYRTRSGPKSAFGQAIEKARQVAADINAEK